MNIDIHSHLLPESFIEKVKKDSQRYNIKVENRNGVDFFVHAEGFAYPLQPNFFDKDAMLKDMQKHRIDLSVLSAPPTIFYYWSDAQTALDVCQTYNDAVSEFVRADPNHFQGMAILPMQDVDASIRELERCYYELGLKAIEVGSHMEGIQFSDERFIPFFKKVHELDMLVFFHPYYIGDKGNGLESYYLTNLLGNPIDTTVAASSIVFSGLLQKFPNLKLFFAHGGGFLPFQKGRLDHGHKVRQESKVSLATPPTQDIQKLIFDTITFDPNILKFLIDTQGDENIVLGSDFPFDMADPDPVSSVERVPGLTSSQRKNILGRNAARLLGL
jgi:aminocarboxymuconate-semialdehyde decarboxylase